jgi:tRNA threonylcarbamoyladenosine biosynthesis protein TsaB
MSLILNIDSSVETASICLSDNGIAVQSAENNNHKDHSAWLQPAVKQVLETAGVSLQSLQAIAVSIGPGSYTGLRIGLSTAKGLCYGLKIPLITVNTLEIMAAAITSDEADFVCPMIDARRMEVFTAVYKKNLEPILPPCALILQKDTFNDLLVSSKIIFTGNGSDKFQAITTSANAIFKSIHLHASLLVKFSHNRFHTGEFADLAYAEPLYIKDFYTTSAKNPGR